MDAALCVFQTYSEFAQLSSIILHVVKSLQSKNAHPQCGTGCSSNRRIKEKDALAGRPSTHDSPVGSAGPP
jgi:hypothetical protein